MWYPIGRAVLEAARASASAPPWRGDQIDTMPPIAKGAPAIASKTWVPLLVPRAKAQAAKVGPKALLAPKLKRAVEKKCRSAAYRRRSRACPSRHRSKCPYRRGPHRARAWHSRRIVNTMGRKSMSAARSGRTSSEPRSRRWSRRKSMGMHGVIANDEDSNQAKGRAACFEMCRETPSYEFCKGGANTREEIL